MRRQYGWILHECAAIFSRAAEPQASENTAQECNIQPYCLFTHQIIDLLYTTVILVAPGRDIQLVRMRSRKVVAACIFNELQAAGLFLALDGTSTCIDPSTSGRNAVFICNESLFVVSVAATSALQLKHTPRLLRSICPTGYQIRTIEYGKILVMLLYGKYYWRVYEVINGISPPVSNVPLFSGEG